MRRYDPIRIRTLALVALFAALVGTAAASLLALFFPPMTARINPAELPDPRPVVIQGGTYTPFTAKPTRPPHPASIYTPRGR